MEIGRWKNMEKLKLFQVYHVRAAVTAADWAWPGVAWLGTERIGHD